MTLNPELLRLLYDSQENGDNIQVPELANIILDQLDYYTGEYCVDTGNMINVEVRLIISDEVFVGKGATFRKSFGYTFNHDITFEKEVNTPANRTIEYRIINDGAGSVNIYFYNKVGLCEFMEELEHEYGDDGLSMGEPTCSSFKCDNFEGTIHSATECYFDVLEILDGYDFTVSSEKEIVEEFKEKFLPERPVIKQGVRDGWLILGGVDTYIGMSLQEAEEKLDLYYPRV